MKCPKCGTDTTKTKHIILPINNIDVKMTQISDIINTYTSLKKLKEKSAATQF